MKTYIVGHKNPDTDSIVSAIALSELEKKLGKDYLPARAGDLNRETEFVLKRFGFEIPEIIPAGEKEVILVDHNEPSQIHENIKENEIKTIFDHHKLGGLSTNKAISIRVKPLGSTSTIIAKLFKDKNIEPSKEVAGILIAGIISDTLNFTSPTNRDVDRKMAEELNIIAGLNLDEFGTEMFKAKSDISGIDTRELISMDYKIFDMKGKKVGIGVWETVLPEVILEREQEILKELEKKKQSDSVGLIYFAAVDIINYKSSLFVVGDEEKVVAEKAFGVKVENSLAELEGIVSRKSQIAPPIETAL
ncbi:manganese-dependent inorganic pyrophosphatase [bacterium (Candidatus Howlettbacteria) CG_4_10_14_0_8_um_filter_40_9]|nr:MAG: manganese-dependent inorganic pyrophosphatase [bacterium (Candidatus Howlettbacteria) CG_4_10_14_0_8_um_filter_40_9]